MSASPADIATLWWNALNLYERLSVPPSHETPVSQQDDERGSRMIAQWREQFPSEAYFETFLTSLDLTEEQLKYLFIESPDALRDRLQSALTWVDDLHSIYAHIDQSPAQTFFWSEKGEFFQTLEPLIRYDWDRLQHTIQSLSDRYPEPRPFNPKTISDLILESVMPYFNIFLGRVYALEINIMRLRNTLEGSTPEERYHYFIDYYKNPAHLLALFERYPVLARQIIIHLKQQVDVAIEWLTRLCMDWPDIERELKIEDHPGAIVSVKATGDMHNSGRSVTILRFETGFQLVYKPRSITVEHQFQQLLHWLNDHDPKYDFYTLRLIARENYGWVEFIETIPCSSEDEVKRFYWRQGAYTALLYVLAAADFHAENLIAMGEHPVLIDLEAMFHPQFDQMETTTLAVKALNSSVMGIGLLPLRMIDAQSKGSVDISGMGAQNGQAWIHPSAQLINRKSDQIRLVREIMTIPDTNNRPHLNAQTINVLDYASSIESGFEDIYRLLLKHADDLLAPDGPITKFADVKVRAILRATRVYAILLTESFHPDLLRSALSRDRIFSRLWVTVPIQPYLEHLIPYERRALSQGDIPVFYTYPSSRDLWDGAGNCLPDLLPKSGLDEVQKRIKNLSMKDLHRQKWFVRASLVTLASEFHTLHEPWIPGLVGNIPVTRESLIAVASKIAAHLESLAYTDDTGATWLSLYFPDEKTALLQPLGLDLYSGLSGAALFLLYLHKTTGDEGCKRLLLKIIHTLDSLLDTPLDGVGIGAFTGIGGVIYTYTHLGVVLGESAYLDKASLYTRLIPELIYSDNKLDLINGCSGAILTLAVLYRAQPAPHILEAIEECANHLVKKAHRTPQGVGWVIPEFSSMPLAGLSHGTSGFAMALLQAATLTGKSLYRDMALDALSYERSVYSDRFGNWLDLREFGEPPNPDEAPLAAWCHGAPGIGLARLWMWDYFNVDEQRQMRQEVDAAIRTTVQTPFPTANHSLCHGALGNLEFLFAANRFFDDLPLDDTVEQLISVILDSMDKNGWMCGVPGGIETVGFMVGLSGIGYELVRLAYPDAVPSILLLEDPIA